MMYLVFNNAEYCPKHRMIYHRTNGECLKMQVDDGMEVEITYAGTVVKLERFPDDTHFIGPLYWTTKKFILRAYKYEAVRLPGHDHR